MEQRPRIRCSTCRRRFAQAAPFRRRHVARARVHPDQGQHDGGPRPAVAGLREDVDALLRQQLAARHALPALLHDDRRAGRSHDARHARHGRLHQATRPPEGAELLRKRALREPARHLQQALALSAREHDRPEAALLGVHSVLLA